MRFGRKAKVPLTTEQRQRAIEKVASKKPKLFRRIKNGIIIGALTGAVAGSQGPAMRQHHQATRDTMQQGAKTIMTIQRTPRERFNRLFSKNKPKGPQVIVGKRMLSGRDERGNTHIGKVDVALQSAKTFRPRIQPGKGAGKGAAAGAGAGAAAGATLAGVGYAKKKRKYNKKMRKIMKS